MRVGLVRVRPQWALNEGPPRRRMIELGEIVAGDGGEVVYGSYFAAPLDVSPTDVEELGRLSALLARAAEGANALLVDFAHPRLLGAYSRMEWLLAAAIRSLHEASPNLTFVIYMETIASRDEQLGLLASGLPEGVVELCDQDGVWLGTSLSDDRVVEAFAEFVDRDTTELDQLASRFIRWRGVFARSQAQSTSYFKYQYTLTGATADQDLSSLIANYVDGQSVAGIIFDDPADPGWLAPCVEEVAYLAGIPYAAADDLVLPTSQVSEASASAIEELRAALAQGGEVVVILPAYKNGQGLRAVETKMKSLGAVGMRVLAILMDDCRLAEGQAISTTNSAHRTVALTRGGGTIDVDYFLSVPIDYLDREHWLVHSAKSLNEISSMTMTIEGGSQVGIWSLFEDYGVNFEQPTPASREPIRWYPQLLDLNEWDARWLVHILVTELMSELACEREQLLVLLPHEANATRELYAAAEAQKGLAVIALDRKVIDGDLGLSAKLIERLQGYRSLSIAALDESAVSGDTLKRIDELVLTHCGKRLDASVAVVTTGTLVKGLFTWRPYEWEARHGHA